MQSTQIQKVQKVCKILLELAIYIIEEVNLVRISVFLKIDLLFHWGFYE